MRTRQIFVFFYIQDQLQLRFAVWKHKTTLFIGVNIMHSTNIISSYNLSIYEPLAYGGIDRVQTQADV